MRLIALLLAALTFVAPHGEAADVERVREPVAGVNVALWRVPHGSPANFETGADGRFELQDAREGTWTAEISIPSNFLGAWIKGELERRGWTRVSVAELRASAEEGTTIAAGGGVEEHVVYARTGDGTVRTMSFSLWTTIDRTIEGPYVKPMRWHHVTGGLSFKFEIGPESEGTISGSVERVLSIAK